MYVNAIKSICQIFALVWLVQNSITQCHFTALRRPVRRLVLKWWMTAGTGRLVRTWAFGRLPWAALLRPVCPDSSPPGAWRRRAALDAAKLYTASAGSWAGDSKTSFTLRDLGFLVCLMEPVPSGLKQTPSVGFEYEEQTREETAERQRSGPGAGGPGAGRLRGKAHE